MRLVLSFALGLSLGAAGVLAFLASPGAPVVMAASDDRTASVPTQRTEPTSSPVLAVAPPVPPPAGNAVFALDLAGWEEVAPQVAGKQENEPQHVWRILGRAYARGGRRDDLLRLADAELAAKRENAIGVLWLFTELPEGERRSALEAVLRAHPDLETLVPAATLGRAWLLAGARDKAFALLVQAARESKGENPDAVGALVGMDAARADSALWALCDGWSAAALWLVSNHLAQGGHPDLAKRWSAAAVAAGAPGPTPAELAAQAAAAVREAESGTREHPDDASAWETLGEARENAGDKKGAFQAFAKALAVAGLDPDLLERLLGLDPAAALPHLERAAKEDGGDDVLRLLARAYVQVGRGREAGEALFRMRDVDEELLGSGLAALAPESALRYAERRLHRRGGADEDTVVTAYADALLASGRLAQAFDAIRPVLERGGGGGDGYETLVRADPGRAVPALEALREERTGDYSLEAALADGYRRLGRKEDARTLAESRVAADPGWPFPALHVLALLDPDKGLPRLAAACEERKDDSSAWRVLGDAYRDLGKTADARAAYRRALEQDSEDYRTLVRLASLR